MNKILLYLGLCLTCCSAVAQKNVVLVTIDGLRWQEVFKGADQQLVLNKKFVKDTKTLQRKFGQKSELERKAALMPFLWNVINKQGVLIGNRDHHSTMSVSNQWYFSYPGYSEIFTGVADNSINSNHKVLNPQISFLEYLNKNPLYQHKLAAFGSWDVFPYILNRPRSQLYINAGFEPAQNSDNGYQISENIKLLNAVQKEIPSPWHNVRLDSFTYRFAKDYLLKQQPKVLTISLGETDDFAHDEKYH
jgi:hypothetical protein